jgi:hypothetical protein
MPRECHRAEEPEISQVFVEAAALYARMPFMITNAQKENLRAIGYDDAIGNMMPEHAHRNLKVMN